MKKTVLVIIYLITFLISNGVVAATLSIEPSPLYAEPPGDIFVDIDISGLQSGGTNMLLGGWELDFTYDPSVFTFLGARFGGGLGDIDLGEAISLAEPVITPGIFHIGVLSFLEGDATTCVFCIDPLLEDLQGDRFTLATVGLSLHGGSSFTGSTPLNLENVVLSDADGFELAGTTVLQGVVNVPEPGVLLLIAFGLSGIELVRKKKYF